MDIYVVSRGRWDRCPTLESLPNVKQQVTLVLHESERDKYLPLIQHHGCKAVAFGYSTIGEKRLLIAKELAGKEFVMLDDDLTFYKRKSHTDWHLRPLEGHEDEFMFNEIEQALQHYAHVGISAREGQNRLPFPHVKNQRYMRVLGYQRDAYLACDHRAEYMEDFDVALQLLKRKLPSYIFTDYAQNQSGTQAKGGCSLHRTVEKHEAAAIALHNRHPDCVKLRNKKNKTGGEFGERVEVTVYWKKAFGG
jgi:hypothetical protein